MPSVEEEDACRSHRERQRLIRERTAHINRIKRLLFAQGIRGIDPSLRSRRIDFAALRTPEGLPIAPRLRQELEREYARLDLVEHQLRAVEGERDVADAQDPAIERKREMLMRVRGIGAASAAILSRELFIRSFANRRQLGSYLGLTPSPYDSGATTRCQGSPRRGTASHDVFSSSLPGCGDCISRKARSPAGTRRAQRVSRRASAASCWWRSPASSASRCGAMSRPDSYPTGWLSPRTTTAPHRPPEQASMEPMMI